MINQKTLNKFDKIYKETYQDVLKYVVINCSNIEDVKDIVQNVYLEVLKILENKVINNNKSYIIGIAKNKINEYYRFNYKAKIISFFSKKEDFDDLELIEKIPSKINIEKYVINNDDIEIIWNYLKRKKVIISKIFYLYYYDDMKIKEISKLLNISESNVKNYLYRTLKELESIMKWGDKNV